ncbi:MAG: hypothetical protein M3N24_02290 [Actinomycetota bacterium]|nr:hypothetical protein [Actinomycetota bacterium]
MKEAELQTVAKPVFQQEATKPFGLRECHIGERADVITYAFEQEHVPPSGRQLTVDP